MKSLVLSLFFTAALCAVVPQNDKQLGSKNVESPKEESDQSRKAVGQEVDPVGDVFKSTGSLIVHNVDLSDVEPVSSALVEKHEGGLKKREINPMVTMANPMLSSRFGGDDNDNMQSNPRYLHTLAAIKPGKHLDLICRLLGIKEKDDIEKVLLLAKTKTKIPPILITTENVGEEENQLIDALNKALDDAAEAKKKLNANEIDKVVEEFLDRIRAQQQERVSQSQDQPMQLESRLGAAEPEDIFQAEEQKPKKSLVDTIKERLGSKMSNLRLKKLQKDDNTPQFVDGPIVQPAATLDYDDDDNDAVESPTIDMNNPEQALQNLQDQVNSAQNNQDLETAKSLLGRIQSMVTEIENNRKSEEDKRKLQIEETPRSPTTVGAAPDMQNRVGEEAPMETKPDISNVADTTSRLKIAVQELKKFPQVVIDTAQKALHSVDEDHLNTLMSPAQTLSDPNLGQRAFPTLKQRILTPQPSLAKSETVGAAHKPSLITSRLAKPSMMKSGLLGSILKPALIKPSELKKEPVIGARIGDTSSAKNAIQSEQKPGFIENLKTKLKNAKPLSEPKILTPAEKSQVNTESKSTGSDILQMIKKNTDEVIQKQAEILKKTHEDTMQKQAVLMKKHEENRQNILKSIKEKMSTLPDLTKPIQISQIKPITGNNAQPEKPNIVSSAPEVPQLQPQQKLPEINQRNNFQDATLGSANPVSDNKNSEVYFIGDGVKLPLKMVPVDGGNVHLSVDIDKLCSCGNVTCPKKRDLAAVLGTLLEKEAKLEDELDTTSSHHGVSAKVARSTDKILKDLKEAGLTDLDMANVTEPTIKELENVQAEEPTTDKINNVGKVKSEDSAHDYVSEIKNIHGINVERISPDDLWKQMTSEETETPGFTKDEEKLLNMLLQPETNKNSKDEQVTSMPFPLQKIMEEVKKHEEEEKHQVTTEAPIAEVLPPTTEKAIKTEETTEKPTESTTIVKRMAEFSPFDAKKDKLSVPSDVSKFSEKYDHKLKIKPYKVAKLEKELKNVENELKAEVGSSLIKTRKLVENGAINILANHNKNIPKDISLMGNILSFMKGFANDK